MTITLGASDTLAGVAGTAGVITLTVTSGDEVTAGVDSFKRLYQGQLPNTVTTLYTATGVTAMAAAISMVNTSGSDVSGVKLFQGGLLPANQITPSITIPANGGGATFDGVTLRVYDSAGVVLSTVTLSMTGDVTGTLVNGVVIATIPNNTITNAKASDMGDGTIKMRALGAGTGDPIDGTPAQAKTLLAIVPSDVTGFDTQVRLSRLDQMAAPTASVSLNSNKLTSVTDGTAANDAATVGQLTAAIEGRLNKDPVEWSTTTGVTLAGLGTQAGGEWTAPLTAGQRILVKDGTAAFRGIYLAAAGGWTRAADANTGAEITNATVLIKNGATLAGDVFTQSATVTTIGTDPQTWVQTGEGGIYSGDATSVLLTGTQFSRAAITGDINIPAGSPTATLPNIVTAAGPFGTAGRVPVIQVNSKGQVSATLTDVAITPGAIGAPTGSGTHSGASSGNNTGDQTDLTLQLDAPGLGAAVTVQKHYNINLNRGIVNILNYLGATFVPDDGSGSIGTDMGAVMNTIFGGVIATNKGGRIILPGGILMRQVTPMVCTQSGVEIDGGGGGYNADTGSVYEGLGCAFIWRGSAGQIMLLVQPSGTGGVGQNVKNFRLSGVSLDGRANTTATGDVGSVRADKGLVLRSLSGWHVEDIYVRDCVASHIEMDVLAPGTIAEAHDLTRGELNRWCIRALDGGGAGGGVGPGIGLVMNGSASANTCYNKISAGQILYNGGTTGKPGLNMINTDSNKFDTVNIFNATGSQTNWGAVVQGGASAVLSSRANEFTNFSPGSAGMILCGTAGGKRPDETADASFNFTAPSANNTVNENTENGEPYVYRGTGVRGPVPGASGGSTFPTQGFRAGGGALASQGPSAAITGAKTTILGVSVGKWFFTDNTQVKVDLEGIWSWGAAIATFTCTIDVGGVTLAQSIITTTATARTAEVMGYSGLLTCITTGATGTGRGGITPKFSPFDAAGGAVTTAAAQTGVGSAAGLINTTIGNAINVTMTCTGTTPSFTPLSCLIRVVN